MQVLVIGSGGREHALAWKAARCAGVEHVFVAPGNAGTEATPGVENVAIAVDDLDGLVTFARDNGVELTIVGPEAPLVAGIVDRFEAAGLTCFGPSAAAARLEGSKAFSKDFLVRHGIPTAAHRTFEDLAEAEAFVREQGAPIVVKADGLAAGKGVIVAQTEEEALAAVRDMLGGDAFGRAGHRVVIEEFMAGEEASFIVVADGERFLAFASSQDHKRVGEGDVGPNTGGMGAYSPAPVVTPEVEARVLERIVAPTIAGMAADGVPYRGFLYAGLMIDAAGDPRVVEFNCRFGDPEAQPVLARLETDLVRLCLQAARGRLEFDALAFDARTALGVVLAAEGYPGAYGKGEVIRGLGARAGATDDEALVFHAGTARDEAGNVVTDGGRVLCVVGLGRTVTEAASRAYAGVARIDFEGMQFRRDIGHRAMAREQAESGG
ncbi:MAG: phosphoribosylamine--glycine ligase [Pseudomonadales bacterium]|jgi:phosphoribosylamine--glycine ligase|nr:phosphoribosylamine--glycine ligase [Pseudomonadales bacterium]